LDETLRIENYKDVDKKKENEGHDDYSQRFTLRIGNSYSYFEQLKSEGWYDALFNFNFKIR
jgi:hypothetical protein